MNRESVCVLGVEVKQINDKKVREEVFDSVVNLVFICNAILQL